MSEIDKLQKIQYDFVESKNWHNKTRLEYLALLGAEVGEAVNESRGKEVNEKYYFELADIGLRLLDLAEVEGISLYDYMIKKMELNIGRDFTGKLK